MSSISLPIVISNLFKTVERLWRIRVVIYKIIIDVELIQARMDNQQRIAKIPSFSRIWSDPRPKLTITNKIQWKPFFTAEEGVIVDLAQQTTVHEIAEEFPTCGNFITANILLCSHDINRGRSRHRTSSSLQVRKSVKNSYSETILEVRNTLTISSNHGERIGRRDEELLSENHGSISISIYG